MVNVIYGCQFIILPNDISRLLIYSLPLWCRMSHSDVNGYCVECGACGAQWVDDVSVTSERSCNAVS